MTRQAAELTLYNHAQRGTVSLPLEYDSQDMIVFFSVPEEHRDYIVFRAVEDSRGAFTVEKCFDLETGVCSVTRVWLTPKEWSEKHNV